MTSLIEPGGALYLVELHPFTWGFGDDDLTLEPDYFGDCEGVSFDEEVATPTSKPRRAHRTIEWQQLPASLEAR